MGIEVLEEVVRKNYYIFAYKGFLMKKIKYLLVSWDIDGTLIDRNSWAYLHQRFGTPPDLRKENMEKYLKGEVAYSEWMMLDLRAMGNPFYRDVEMLLENGCKVKPSVKSVLRKIRRVCEERGIELTTCLISGGIDIVANKIRKVCGELIDVSFCNYLIPNSQGRVEKGVGYVSPDNKDKILRRLKEMFFHEKENLLIVYVGDSFWDGSAFKEADYGICVGNCENCKGKDDVCYAKKNVKLEDVPKIIERVLDAYQR